MFARVQTFRHPAETLDQIAARARDEITASPPPGLAGSYFLVDRDNGKALLISLWESRDDLHRLEATNATTRARMRSAGIGVPEAEVFEVALRTA